MISAPPAVRMMTDAEICIRVYKRFTRHTAQGVAIPQCHELDVILDEMTDVIRKLLPVNGTRIPEESMHLIEFADMFAAANQSSLAAKAT